MATPYVAEANVQVRPTVANPAPLGLAAFGLTTVVLSSINAGLIPREATSAVVPLAFAYGGLAQIIAGILEFKNGSTFGTTAFTSYGLFWWWYASLNWTIGAGWIKPPAPQGVAVALLMWGVFSFYMWIATFRINLTLWAVFLLVWVTLFLLAAGDFGMATTQLGGWTGLAAGLGALYLSAAELINGTFGRTLVPVGQPLMKA